MTDHGLREHIGLTLRRRREREGLTQAELAGRSAVTQAMVARIERGERAPSVAVLERLFAAFGCQVRLVLEPLDKDVDDAIAALTQEPLGERVAAAGIAEFASDLDPIQHVFVGATAALLQGAPVPADRMEIALARDDCDDFTRWLSRRYGARWHRHYQEFGFVPLDPRQPGEPLWRVIGNIVVRVELVDELPASFAVGHGGRTYRVVPLASIEIDDPETARLLRRFREGQQRPEPQ